MPFSLGFWAAAGGGAVLPADAFELISTTLLSSTTSSVTFSSIPQTYKHLQIRWTGRNNVSWGSDGGSTVYWMQVNGSSSAVYSTHNLRGEYSSVSSASNSSLTYSRFLGSLANAFSPSNAFTGGVVDILDYTNSSTNKTLKSMAGYVSGSPEYGGLHVASSAFNTTGAVTSLTVGAGNTPGSYNFISGSRFSLYGIKGA